VFSSRLNQKVAVSVVFVAAMFMNIMDVTIVNVALPTIGREFHVRPDSVDTVAIGYLVSLSVFIPASGWLGDRFGARRMLLISVVVFTGASALCGSAQSLGQLVGFRILQGFGGGLMVPVGMALLYRTFPPEERVRASSILVIPTAVAPALGPVLGGLFVTELSWRWVFFVNVPIGVAAWLFGVLFLGRHQSPRPGHFDILGFVLSAGGLALLMYGISEGPFKTWGDPLVVGTIVVGAVMIAALIPLEYRSAEPLIDVRLFKDRLFRSCSAVISLGSIAFLGVLFTCALFFQDGLGLSALQSGLSTFPEAIGVMLGAQLATRRLYPVFGPRRVMAGGMLVLAAAVGPMSLVNAGTSLWWMRTLLFFAGFGMGHVFTSTQAAGFATISVADTARASTVFNALRQLCGAVGVAALSTVVAEVGPLRSSGGHLEANLTAYHAAFLLAAVVAVVGAVVSLSVSDADAVQTMVRRGRLARPDRDRAASPVPAGGT
jgi:EmrB/QacA subfamily drug resistance transporter